MKTNIQICQSPIFRASIAKAIALTTEHSPKEAGFACWSDGEKFVINEPVIGKPYSMPGHDIKFNPHPLFSGYNEGMDSQSVIHVHTHPLRSQEAEWKLLAPSFADIKCLMHVAELNWNVTQNLGHEFWVNPIEIIVSPASRDWSFVQINPRIAREAHFDINKLWSKAVRLMFRKYYPSSRERPLAEYGDMINTNVPGALFGLEGTVQTCPKFLTSRKRFGELLGTAGVTWRICGPDSLSSDMFSYENSVFGDDDE